MGKKSASKDRGYVTATEWKVDGGGWKDKTAGLPFRRLPFNCCAISFVPFDDPVCAADGTVMDIMHAVPYVQKHGKHPVTGEPLALKDLTKLTFHKNADGEYECPVLNKTFTDSRTSSPCERPATCTAIRPSRSSARSRRTGATS